MRYMNDFMRGFWKEHPIFVLVLGMCPTLAVTNTAVNGLAMGLATSFVLITSGPIISLVKGFIPRNIRIPCYIVVIATFVTVADYMLNAFWNDIHHLLGLFVPLIVVNCLILGRAEAFSSKNNLTRTIIDDIGYGFGFTWGLIMLGIVREILGFGSIFGVQILSESFSNWIIMLLPSGAFLTLGLMLGIYNKVVMVLNNRGKVEHVHESSQKTAAG